MKKVPLILAVIFLFAVLTGCTGTEKPGDAASAQQSNNSGAAEQNPGAEASACYRDSMNCFSDLDSLAGYIVRARVTDVVLKVGQKATLTVSHVYRGNVPDTISLYQMPEDNGVSAGEEYLLFMGPQQSEDPDSGEYFAYGAGAGVIRLVASEKVMYIYNACINDADFAAWRSENGFGDWTVKGG